MGRKMVTKSLVVLAGIAVLVACGPVKKAPPAPPAGPSHGTTTFDCTAGAQTFTVPAGITSIGVDAFGAQGGTGAGGFGGTGGMGGRASATVPVTPGESLQVNVGC